MKVTGFDLRKSTAGSSLAYGRVVLDNLIEVEVTLMEGKNGIFVSYPSRKGKDNKWYKQFKIIDPQVSEQIQNQIVYFYEQNIKNLGPA